MKSKVSETEIKAKEYADYTESDENTPTGDSRRLDLNVLLKRLKDQKESDKKLSLILQQFIQLLRLRKSTDVLTIKPSL